MSKKTARRMIFLPEDGKVRVVLNWRHRSNDRNVAILKTLTSREAELYANRKSQGLSDSRVFSQLFPVEKEPRKTISVDVNLLHKGQLMQLIQGKVGAALSSLTKLNKADLIAILMALEAKS